MMKFGMGVVPFGTTSKSTFEYPTIGDNKMTDEESHEVDQQ
jgi:hypothetical protein